MSSSRPRDLPGILPAKGAADFTITMSGRSVGMVFPSGDKGRKAYQMGLTLANQHNAYLPVDANDLPASIGVRFDDVFLKAEFEKGFYDGMMVEYRAQKAQKAEKLPGWLVGSG